MSTTHVSRDPDEVVATAAHLEAAMVARQWAEAEALCDLLIARSPGEVHLHHQRGLALWKQERHEEALQAFACAMRLPGHGATLLADYSLLLATAGAPQGAVEICRAAVAAHPARQDLLNNLGIALLADGQVQEALQHFNHALQIAPGSATSIWNRGFARLLLGDLKGFLADNEARFAGSGLWATGTAELDNLPLWMGEPITGRHLLVHAEQGFGDTLQFIRFIPLLAALKPARLTVHVQAEVLPALRCLHHFAEFHPIGSVISHCHFSIPLLSVPHRLGIDWPNLPAWSPYLAPEAGRVRYWRERLAAAAAEAGSPSPPSEARTVRLRVGLVWRGGAGPARGHERSVPLQALHVLALPGIEWVSLQAGPAAREAREDTVLQPLPLGEDLVDFADTAALISQLDLVICIDTAVAHLAGALGHPTWMLDAGVGPLWLSGRTDSPWYPTVQLFRQPSRGDWHGLVQQVLPALQARVADHLARHGCEQACSTAQALLEADRLPEAASAFAEACARWTGAAPAWLGAARAAEQMGHHEQALAHALKAREVAPADVEPHVQLARLQQMLQRPFEAMCSYQQALARDPAHLTALGGLARLLRQRDCPGDALPLALERVRLDRHNPAGLAELAHTSLAASDPLSALRWAQASLALGPQQPELQALSARCLALLADALPALAPAIARFQAAPGEHALQFALAEALFDAGLPLPAIGLYQRVLSAGLDHGVVRSLSDALIAQADWQGAAQLGETTALHFPEDDDLRCDHATALWKLGDLAAAESIFKGVLARQPQHLAALLHDSAVALAQVQPLRAEVRAEQAMALAPHQIEPLLACAAAAEARGDDPRADHLLQQVLARHPGHAQARFNRSLLALKAGDWSRGWTDYDARAEVDGVRAFLGAGADQVPRWQGGSLAGRHLVVCAEQGLGDTLQTLRCLPLLAAFQPARITLQVQMELAGWLRTLPNPVPGAIFEVMPRGVPVRSYQTFVPLLSLPGLLGLHPDTVPAPWLPSIDPQRSAFWRDWLGPSNGGHRRVGLCWAGNPTYPRDRERSPGLPVLLPLLSGQGGQHCDWISLVYGERGSEGQAHGLRRPALSPALGFGDTAALLSGLDLVITCDTAITHLAAGLGVPTWLMLAHASDWRWGPGNGRSPWYPEVRQFRQDASGDWSSVVSALCEAMIPR